MIRKIALLTLVLGGIALCQPAFADHRHHRGPRVSFGFGFGIDHFGFGLHFGGRSGAAVVRFAPPVHVHRWEPVYVQEWVPPVYQTVFAGYDCHGFPIYRQVQTCGGYYRTVVRGHHCGCGASY